MILANAADVDFVPGALAGHAVAFHHGPTHSIAFGLALSAAWLGARRALARSGRDRATGPSPALPAAAVLAVALSHPLLDWLTGEPGADASVYGIAAFWPLSDARTMSDWHLFGAYHIDTLGLVGGVLTPGAFLPLLREVAFVAACFGLARAWRRRGTAGSG